MFILQRKGSCRLVIYMVFLRLRDAFEGEPVVLNDRSAIADCALNRVTAL